MGPEEVVSANPTTTPNAVSVGRLWRTGPSSPAAVRDLLPTILNGILLPRFLLQANAADRQILLHLRGSGVTGDDGSTTGGGNDGSKGGSGSGGGGPTTSIGGSGGDGVRSESGGGGLTPSVGGRVRLDGKSGSGGGLPTSAISDGCIMGRKGRLHSVGTDNRISGILAEVGASSSHFFRSFVALPVSPSA